MAKGRKKEVFTINFNQELNSQLEPMTMKQLFHLLLVILVTIPVKSFSQQEHNESTISIMKYIGKLVRYEVKEEFIQKKETHDIWAQAEAANAHETVTKMGPILTNFLLGLSGNSFGFFYFIPTLC